MDVNLNTAPYYDDFDSTKNFYRILFKPGTPVQARELTQIQSILQDQIKKFANHIFIDGSRVGKDDPVAVTINPNVKTVKLLATTATANLTPYIGKYVTGQNNNFVGKVKFVYDADNPTLGDPPTLAITIEAPNGNNEFDSSESLYFYDSVQDAFTNVNVTLPSGWENYTSEQKITWFNDNNISVTTLLANGVTIADINWMLNNGYYDDQVLPSLTTESDIIITGTAITEGFSDTITLVGSTTGTIKIGDYVSGVSGAQTGLYVVAINSSTSVTLNKNFGVTLYNTGITFTRKNTSPVILVGISSGAYYKNGYFVQVPSQSVIPQKYTAYPSKSVILRYEESIVDFNNDSSVLDPAFGSSNYLAPGADRLKIELVLDSVDLTTDNKPNYTDKFIEIARFIEGKVDLIESAIDTTYSELGKVLADRTYAESGNYTVNPFKLESSGTTPDGQNNKFYISSGRVFIGGYDITTTDKTELIVPKSRDTKTATNQTLNTFFGEYILINAPRFGLPDINHWNYKDIYECHNTTDRNAMTTETLVGILGIKHIQYDSGYGQDAIYRLYYNAYIQGGNHPVWEIKSIIGISNDVTGYYGATGTYARPDFFANINPTYGIGYGGWKPVYLKVFETVPRSRLVFDIGQKNISDVTNKRIVYSKYYSNVVISGGTSTITTTLPNKFVGTPSSSQTQANKRQYLTVMLGKLTSGPFYVSGSGSAFTATSNSFLSLEDIAVTLNSDATSLTINYGNSSVNGSATIIAAIENDNYPRRTKTLVQNYTAAANILYPDIEYSIFKSDIFSLKGIYKTGYGNNTFIGNHDSGVTYTTDNLVQANSRIYRAVTTNINKPVSNVQYWAQIQGESLLSYYLDNGQKDDVYDHGVVRYLGSQSTIPGNVLIVFDYFTHSGTGVFDVKSYPATMYDQIPIYRSPIDAAEFNLKNSLDFRARRQDDTGWRTGSPYANRESDIYYWGDYIKPLQDTTTGTQADITYYLGRVDRLYVQNKDANTAQTGNKFYLDRGIPADNPIAKEDVTNKNSQLIATLISPPYTASSADVKIVYNDSLRYTMKDISVIDKKLTALEKRVKRQGLDIIALNNTVFDRRGIDGNVLYKTGIFVEDFSSYNSADITNPKFSATMDLDKKECRPAITATKYNLFYESDPSADFSLINNWPVLKYTSVPFISQLTPSANIEVNPHGIDTGARVTAYYDGVWGTGSATVAPVTNNPPPEGPPEGYVSGTSDSGSW